jgi:hypothetical protein
VYEATVATVATVARVAKVARRWRRASTSRAIAGRGRGGGGDGRGRGRGGGVCGVGWWLVVVCGVCGVVVVASRQSWYSEEGEAEG